MGLATQLVSWGPAAAEGAARLVELNLATEKLPPQSALLGLDAHDASLHGTVLLLRAKGGLWAAHAALAAQAPTLVWLAAEAGAAAVVFVWPGGLVQPLLPHPNHDVASPIPSVVLPDTHPAVTALLLAARKAHNANPAEQGSTSGSLAPSPIRTPAPPASPPSPTTHESAAAATDPAPRLRLEPAGATAAAVIARRCGALLRWRAVGGVWPFAAASTSASAPAAASASARALRLTARGLGTVGGVAVRYSGTALGVAGLAARASGAAVTTAAGVATTLVGAAADSMGAFAIIRRKPFFHMACAAGARWWGLVVAAVARGCVQGPLNLSGSGFRRSTHAAFDSGLTVGSHSSRRRPDDRHHGAHSRLGGGGGGKHRRGRHGTSTRHSGRGGFICRLICRIRLRLARHRHRHRRCRRRRPAVHAAAVVRVAPRGSSCRPGGA